MACSLPFVSPSSASTELCSVVNHSSVNILETDPATIPTDSISLDEQPLPSSSVESSACAVVVNDLPPPPDLYDWKWLSSRKSHLDKLYQLGTATPSMIAVPIGQRRFWEADSSKIIVAVNPRGEVLSSMSVFQYAAAFSDRVNVCRFVLEMHLNGHEF